MNAVGKVTTSAAKSLEDVKLDMSEQYEAVKAGSMDLRLSNELSNITGKYLKAVALEYARDNFLKSPPHSRVMAQIEDLSEDQRKVI